MRYTVQNVNFNHANGSNALKNISLAFNSGECVAIIGASGSGKTTLLSLLATALKPTSGSIDYNGKDPWLMSNKALKKLRSLIGTVHQSPPIPSQQRVITAILAGRLGQWSLLKSVVSLIYPLDLSGPHRCLERLQLGDRLFDRCDQLSGGQLQRVGVARVLYQAPQLILADEPVSAMDPVLSDVVIKELIEETSARGASLIASLHAVDLAIRWFPRIIGIKNGEIAFDLPSAKVSEQMLSDLYESEIEPTRPQPLTAGEWVKS
jgi:phosphonate transport system ATP-binding protein